MWKQTLLIIGAAIVILVITAPKKVLVPVKVTKVPPKETVLEAPIEQTLSPPAVPTKDLESSPMYLPDVNKMDHVIGNIFISNWPCSVNPELLQKNNIKYILCLNKENKKSKADMDMYRQLGISTLYIVIGDSPADPIDKTFDTSYKFIESSINPDGSFKGNVLVHCTMGISRSAATVLMYLMRKLKNTDGTNITKDQAYQLLKSKRSCANPNPGFMAML